MKACKTVLSFVVGRSVEVTLRDHFSSHNHQVDHCELVPKVQEYCVHRLSILCLLLTRPLSAMLIFDFIFCDFSGVFGNNIQNKGPNVSILFARSDSRPFLAQTWHN